MADPLPPDPYLALDVPKDATQAAVKTAHRKLVLKCHPDKVADPAEKAAAADQFHRIQTAYEILVDEQRRERYDAQVKLAALRKEKLERQGSGGFRGGEQRAAPSPYRTSQESVPRATYSSWEPERPTPQYEERRPSYAKEYFDLPRRVSARKDHDYERSSRRPAPEPKHPKTRGSARESKDNERERRKEKTKRAERDTRRDRDRKYGSYVEDGSESNSDEHERTSRRTREEDAAATARKARDAYHEQATKQQREAKEGYVDDRTRKMFAASADAWDYIRSSRGRQQPDSERRPSPVRMASSKENLEYPPRRESRPSISVRRPSERPKTTTRDNEFSRRTSLREPERRSSEASVTATRKTPTLNQSRSSPGDIRLPTDKPRAQSVQIEPASAEPSRVMRRSETMPYESQRRTENFAPAKSSNARATEYNDGLATPATTPEYPGQSTANSTKYRYGKQYADDTEYPTPDGFKANDGYRTEVRQPGATRPSFLRKVTRSPSPVADSRDVRDARDPREKPRTSSLRHPSSPHLPSLNRRMPSYVHASGPGADARQNTVRGTSPREPQHALYGEIGPDSDTPRAKHASYPPPEESAHYRGPFDSGRPESFRVQSGYNHGKRPSVSRTGSGHPFHQTGVRA